MIKSKQKDNTLIKINKLSSEMKNAGITRVSDDSLYFIDQFIWEKIKKIIPSLKQEMIIHGRKTLKKEDVKSVLELKKEFSEI
ncbi:NFYB/HAP3 family transcription factor subunit [Candidatus Pacearchaeota archaeon]|nr:NFYB/HAP3 family transcription factor subunit [Candidatus Pacearchaeota archaeon]